VTERVLLAVEDSATGLEAAAVAVDLAAALGARLLAVHVVPDGEVVAALSVGRRNGARVRERRSAAAMALLRHVAARASLAGVPVETLLLDGDPAPQILAAARRWDADLLVIGRSEPGTSGPHYVGAQTRHVLEFADHPVLVVPCPPRRAA
jgi:nucleotide-binding universal stress UspA family protein